MLSKAEEEHFDFVKIAQARKLGVVRSNQAEGDVAMICQQLFNLSWSPDASTQ